MRSVDVIVIGAGPAGCATAVFLARQGRQVVLLDRAFFPRDKVCGEFISPAADAILDRIGVLSRIEEGGTMRLDGVAISAYGGPERLIPYPSHPDFPGRVSSLSVERLGLDRMLVERAAEVGVDVRQGHQVTDFILEGDRVVGVKGKVSNGKGFELRATVVVDAGGRNAVSLRKFRLKVEQGKGNRIALAAHWDNVHFPDDYCYMHVSRPGYTGMSPTEGGGGNVVLVVDPSVVDSNRMDAAYREIVLSNPRRRKLLDGAVPRENVRAVGSLSFRVNPPPVGGLLLVGDAMGFIDPFTGEGIYLALRSAEMAAGCIHSALDSGNVARTALMPYETERNREFHLKFILCRVLQVLIYNKRLCRGTVSLLGKRPDLAADLVGVIGDYVDPKKVVSPGFLGKVLLGILRGALDPPAGGNKKKTPVLVETPAPLNRQQ